MFLIPMASCIIAAWATFIVSLGVHYSVVRQTLVGLVSLGATFLGLMAFPFWIEGYDEFTRVFHHMEGFWEYFLFIAVYVNFFVVVGLILPIALAAAQLTHAVGDRSFGPRAVVLGIILNGLLSALGQRICDRMEPWVGRDGFWEIVSFSHAIICLWLVPLWALLAIYATTEGSRLSIRQQQAHLTRSRFFKAFNFYCAQGVARGRAITIFIAPLFCLISLFHCFAGRWHVRVGNEKRKRNSFHAYRHPIPRYASFCSWRSGVYIC